MQLLASLCPFVLSFSLFGNKILCFKNNFPVEFPILNYDVKFKKKIKDFFVGEKVEDADTSKYSEDEKSLNDQLKEIADSYKPQYDPAEGYEDLSDLLPEKIEFEYREYEGKDEQGIKDSTSQKYKDLLESESKIVSDKYDTKVGEVEY